VAAFVAELDRVDVLVNNAGGAFDAKPVAEADVDSWQRAFDVNVLGTLRMTRALLPALIASGAGDVVFVGSTAGLISYEGGASYTAAKHGVHTMAATLRLELFDQPVRVIEIAPGMVRTEEFSVNRLGSADAADAVYRGVREPLVAEDVADCIAWTVTRPHHVNVDLMVVRPRAQAAQHKVHREEEEDPSR
jgi:NADP-dependent 3-hydroxy acid dehydrogenase YdfG